MSLSVKRLRITPGAFVATLAVLLSSAGELRAQGINVTQYHVTPSPSSPIGIKSGPDGALWFTDDYAGVMAGNTGSIGRITTAGVVTNRYPITVGSEFSPQAIVTGSDGALWFTQNGSVGRVTTAGNFTLGASGEFSPVDITSGSDGSLWFTDTSGGNIWKLTTAGVLTPYALPGEHSGADSITSGPDGALWFTADGHTTIGRITTAGVFSAFTSIPNTTFDESLYFGTIVTGSDGALWFTVPLSSAIGKITTAMVVTTYGIPSDSEATVITSGSDGALWAIEPSNNQLVRVTTAGAVTEYALPAPPTGFAATLNGIASGPDGDLWYTKTVSGIGQEFVEPAGVIGQVAIIPPVVITAACPATTAILNQPYSFAITTTGGLAPLTWTLATDPLPPGLTLNSATGVISGTPTTVGTYPIYVTVTDSSEQPVGSNSPPVYNCNIIVTTQLMVTATCPAAGAVQNAAYSFQVTATGGLGTLAWNLTTGPLPPGLALNPANGVISGTPTTVGTYPFSVTVSDTSTPPQMAVYSCSIVVSGRLTVTATCSTNTAVLNTPYSFSITTSGGLAPLTWTLATGPLPPGLTLNTGTGLISGTPTTVGTYPYSVQVSDSTAPTKQTATFNCSITVATQLTITSGCPAPAGFPSTAYTYTLTASGGTQFNPAASGYVYQWSILPAASSLPPGLALLNTGTPSYLEQIKGTPTTAGPYSFTLQAQDAGGQVATKACSIVIIGPLTITAPVTPALPNGTQNSPYSGISFQAQGGVIPYSWSASGLPAGLTLSTTGVLNGTPTQLGTFNPTVTVIDSSFFSANLTDYPVPTAGANPYDIVQGPDGALWFTESNANQIGRISTAGVVTNEFPIPTPGSQPAGLVVGPDGALWFTETVGNKIGRMTTAGVVTNEFPIPTANAEPYGITVGPDGALWFTEALGNKIGRMTAAGVVTNETPVPTEGSTPEGITVGSDGALWFTEINGNNIGRITTASVITNEFTVPTAASSPSGIVAGPDGALWFTEGSAAQIGRITTAGVVTNEYPIPTATSGSQPFGITVGPDGALWFTEGNGNNLGRITTAGVLTQYTVPTPAGAPAGIAAGPDGAVWFTEFNGDKIGRVGLGGAMAQRTYTLTITLPVLSINAACPAPVGAQGYQYILFPITVTGGNGVYTLTYTGPAWLSLVTASGTAVGGSFITSLTGIAPAQGTYPISVQAQDTAGSTPAVYSCNIVINPPPLGITASCPASFTIGVPISEPLSAAGGSGGYSWSISSGSLPSGVQLIGSVISGTPTGSPGVANFTIEVSSGGAIAQESCSVTIILAPLKFTGVCPGNGAVNAPYGPLTLTATGGLGQSSYSFSFQGSLPPGVSLSGNTVGGTPTTAGTYNFTFQVSSGTQTANGSPCSVTIAPAALGITGSCSAASINVGATFSMSVSVTGGKSPYAFSISGAPWVTLNPPSASGDTASGTPIAANGGTSYTVVITAGDSANSTPVSFSCNVAVNPLPKLTISLSCPASSIPPGTPVNIPASAGGGLAPYSWSISGNSGLSLSSSAGSSNSVVGNAPTAAGNYSFSVSVGDSASSPAASQGCSFTVPFSQLQIQGACPASSLNLPVSLSIPLSASGGQPPYSWSLSAPSWLGLSATSGSPVTLSSTGTPSTAGPFSFTVSLSDSANNTASPFTCSSTINAPAVPPLTITGLTPTTNPMQTVNVGVQLGSPAPLPLTGILQLTFIPNAFGITNNPQVVFSGGSTQFTFTIPAGQTTVPIPNIQQGTVAGTIVVTLIDLKQGGNEVLPTPAPFSNLVIPQQTPVITSVCFSNETSNSFDVLIAGYSNPRNMTSVTVAFQAASGSSISGTSSFTENVASLFSQFYSSAQSQLAGSLFTGFDVPVTISGNVSAIGSVTITLTNSVGNSQPFTQSLTSANACTAGSS